MISLGKYYNNRLIAFIFHFLVSGCFLGITYFQFGSFYEEYQGFWNAFFSGALTEGAEFDNFYFLGYIGISHIYTYLQMQFPNIQWFSVFHFLQLNISFAIFFSILNYLFEKQKLSRYWFYSILPLIFFGFFLDNIILFVYARASYLLCGASYLAIIILFKDIGTVKKQLGVFVPLILLFLWGDLTRVESAMAVSLLLFCFAVVWHQNLQKALVLSLPVLFIVGFSLAGIFLDIHYSSQFHKEVEPDIETQFTVRGNVIPIESMTSYADSIKYEAAMRMFWADPDIITIPYLRSLINEPESKYFDSKQWQRVGVEIRTGIKNFKYPLIVLLLLSAAAIVLAWREAQFGQMALIVLYFLGFVILLVVNSYFVKMRDRTISPFILVYSMSMLFLIFDKIKQHGIIFYLSVFVLFVWSILNVGLSQRKSEFLTGVRQTNQLIFEKVEDFCAGQTLMPNPTSMGNITLAFAPFQRFDFDAFHRLYFYEASIQSIIPPYYDYLNQACDCDVWDFSAFYRYVLNPDYPTPVYTLSNEDRMIMAMEYLKNFHQLDIEYKKVEEVDLNENMAMDYYSMRKLYLYQISLKNYAAGSGD